MAIMQAPRAGLSGARRGRALLYRATLAGEGTGNIGGAGFQWCGRF